ncbi:hypothetical protein N7468_007982 [Penicillium chermesinum]|uniref:Uncharacterized protein n=1 Tax=Penicillium chermesinum TaxID=63820 RepID=A0A9W9NP22_9EURO|nr:uncharacterized protein N7468_007982 [Penicillium chermesinum]KAJ5223440.1 hypothetical protein N7468_007982 [Penicillium chermesinum]KAJ6155725.1 hypothetical protein N7470_006291 [Penicillium chermesinum]
MADPPSPSRSPLPPRNPASATLRRRGFVSRASLEPELPQRRNSTLSDTLSEARNSIRSSTDDLFLPKVARGSEPTDDPGSHWHSAPLVLALLPAIAGVLFKNGSVFVTDVTLIVLAAIFLNWSVRLPWDWYRSAQAIQREPSVYAAASTEPVESEGEGNDETAGLSESTQKPSLLQASVEANAVKELQVHELAALASCFVFPVIGTWLLHGIRSSLSRPSEGLVSNYNLTIFLLASEIRPVAHLLKLVQARTLHLQRIVSTADDSHVDPDKVQDLSKRLEELEAHVAETAAARLAKGAPQSPNEQPDAPSLVAQAVLEARHAIQPDIEALNRAVRRYEKRTAFIALQSDERFQNLATQSSTALSLAAAAQRSVDSRHASYAFTLVDWVCACIVIPTQLAFAMLNLPIKAVNRGVAYVQQMLGISRAVKPRYKAKGKAVGTPKIQSESPPPMKTRLQPQGDIAPFTSQHKQPVSRSRGAAG